MFSPCLLLILSWPYSSQAFILVTLLKFPVLIFNVTMALDTLEIFFWLVFLNITSLLSLLPQCCLLSVLCWILLLLIATSKYWCVPGPSPHVSCSLDLCSLWRGKHVYTRDLATIYVLMTSSVIYLAPVSSKCLSFNRHLKINTFYTEHLVSF